MVSGGTFSFFDRIFYSLVVRNMLSERNGRDGQLLLAILSFIEISAHGAEPVAIDRDHGIYDSSIFIDNYKVSRLVYLHHEYLFGTPKLQKNNATKK